MVRLGGSGLKVGRICLGTMIFGSQLEEPAAFAVLDRAAELEIDFIDTADAYPVPPSLETAGRTEELVGRWIRARGSRAVIATKCGMAAGPGPNDRGGSRKHVIEACERSLRRLGLEAIDLFYLHWPDPDTPIEETLEAFDRLRAAGKIHYAGLSNFEAWQLGLALAAPARRPAAIAAVQPRYNLLCRGPERDLIPLCQAAGLGVFPYNPLGAGVLAGRYSRGSAPPQGSRFDWGDYGAMYRGRYWHDRMFDVAEKVTEVSRQIGATPGRVALAWLLGRPGVAGAVVGASHPAQLDDSVGALELELAPEYLDLLDEASQPFR